VICQKFPNFVCRKMYKTWTSVKLNALCIVCINIQSNFKCTAEYLYKLHREHLIPLTSKFLYIFQDKIWKLLTSKLLQIYQLSKTVRVFLVDCVHYSHTLSLPAQTLPVLPVSQIFSTVKSFPPRTDSTDSRYLPLLASYVDFLFISSFLIFVLFGSVRYERTLNSVSYRITY